MVVRHDFPADGEYKFAIQNFGIGSFIPGEQLELIIDGERAHVCPVPGRRPEPGDGRRTGDGMLEVTVPVKAGSRMVGATFLATNYRPSLDMIRQYDRKSLENNSIPQLQYYPAIGFLRISGPVQRAAAGGLAQPPQGASRAGPAHGRRRRSACARQILTTLARRAYRRPADGAGRRRR